MAGLAATSGALLATIILAALAQWPAAVAVPVATLALLTLPTRSSHRLQTSLRQLLVVMVLLALVLTVAVEYYVLRNIDIGRVNTVFKLYLQVWVLWGIAAAVSAGTVYNYLPKLRAPLRETWRVAFIVLVSVCALYPILAARAKIDDRFSTSVGRTLDGTAFMTKAVFTDHDVPMRLDYDLAAMRWMLQHVDGSPVVAEANTAPTLYGWEARYAMFTGNPTIVGWDFHQRQQRPPQSEQVQTRVKDVQRAYETPNPAVAYTILRYYGARYVVVGPLERVYWPTGVGKWERGDGTYWKRVYANPGVRIYRVLPTPATS
jgi:uncharacterized membrane protein